MAEFRDVNPGEKAFMQLWNAHVRRPAFRVRSERADLVAACLAFVRAAGPALHRLRLRNNFVLHLTTLADFGLLSPAALGIVLDAYSALTATLA